MYLGALAIWMVTRLVVLVHQGAWPWMNAFVVAAARGMVVGDWNDAVRPQLPAVLGVPLVLVGASEQQTVAVLYLIASLVQFAAFVVVLRALYPGQLRQQAVGLLVFLLLPYNHSIHHYRDMPVVLASAAVFLLAAEFVRLTRSTNTTGSVCAPFAVRGRDVAIVGGSMLLGIWSRAEVLTFVGALMLLALLVWRSRAFRLAALYIASAAVVSASLLMLYRLEPVDLSQALFYQAHTFLDSTPDSWLSAECRADPTENCREYDGLTYFGPADLHAGVLPLVLNHPLTTVAKTAQSAWDNLWILFGPNLSTFPGLVPFVVLAAVVAAPARGALRSVTLSAWLVALAVVAETVAPPLSWAPPHPQYHLQLVLSIVIVLVPMLLALARMPRGRLLAGAFLAGSAVLSVLRYTRYPGY
jgi:hypothetical protein